MSRATKIINIDSLDMRKKVGQKFTSVFEKKWSVLSLEKGGQRFNSKWVKFSFANAALQVFSLSG